MAKLLNVDSRRNAAFHKKKYIDLILIIIVLLNHPSPRAAYLPPGEVLRQQGRGSYHMVKLLNG